MISNKIKKRVKIIAVLALCIGLMAGCGGAGGDAPAKNADTTAYADTYIDLHLHLDGALTVDIAKKLAALQNITLPAQDDTTLKSMLSAPADCDSLNELLKCFDLPLTLMQTKEGLSEAVFLVMEDLKASGVVYAELRFAPQYHTDKGMTQEEAVLAALDGLKRSDLKGNLILCCMRGEDTTAANRETVELAKKYLVETGGVVALDLAGAAALYPITDYKDTFKLASDLGVPFTIHAGEVDDGDNVRIAMEMGAKRIGHGVRIQGDTKLMELVRDEGVCLELCPTSERLTKSVEDMSHYPIIEFLDMGIKATLNTDNTGVANTTMAEEFRYMEKDFGLTGEQERQMLRNAVDAAFTDDATKAQLRTELKLD